MSTETTQEKPKKPYLSYSAISTFTKCPLQFEFRYVKGMKKAPPGTQLAIGSAVHDMAELTLKHKMQNGEPLTVAAQKDAARDALLIAWKGDEEKDRDPVELTPEEKAVGAERTQGNAIDLAVTLAELHHTELATKLQPHSVEEKFRLEIDGSPYDLLGYIDVTEKPEQLVTLRDLKTKGKSPGKAEADESLQMTIYALAINSLYGHLPEDIVLDCLVKTKKPKYVEQHTTRTPEDLVRLLHRIRITIKALETGVYAPTDPSNWWCGEKWCGYWNDCPFGGGPALPVHG